MQHDFSEVFETDNELWQRVLEIFERNEKYDKKVVSNRNLHHKYPRSFSKRKGEPVDNDKDNLISLSLADHFLVHYYYYLLAKKGYRQAMATAFTFMAKKGLKYLTPETAEAMAKDYAEAKAISHIMDDEIKNKISNTLKGHDVSDETRNKISSSSMGKKMSDNAKDKIAKTMLTVVRSDFGKKFKEHYGPDYGSGPTHSLYTKEYRYYKKHGKCSWEDEIPE